MDKTLRMAILTKIPIKDTIFDWFEELISNIESDIFDDYMKLDEKDWRKFYKTTYEILIEKYSKHKKILKLKRKLYFEELCEFYNIMIEEYKGIVKDTSLDDPQSLNRRTSLYHIILDWYMDEVFEFKDTKETNKSN